MGSGNELTPNSWQVIFWTTYGLFTDVYMRYSASIGESGGMRTWPLLCLIMLSVDILITQSFVQVHSDSIYLSRLYHNIWE